MPPREAPDHILFVGSGVFGLSTAYALGKRSAYAGTRITLVSPELADAAAGSETTIKLDRALPASIDTTRIVRADYADPMYAQLAAEAQELWRTYDWGGNGVYNESGLLLAADKGSAAEAYVRKSYANIRAQQGDLALKLLDAHGIETAMQAGSGVAKGSGDLGYINSQSGWADAEAGLRRLERMIRRQGRVKFVQGNVARLTKESNAQRVTGVELDDGRSLKADLVVLAAGAWTPALVDMRGRASCTAQVMAYFDISDAAAKALNNLPVHLNIANGCFFFPPNRKSDGGWEIKAAIHAFGYSNPTTIPAPLGADKEKNVTVSLPASSLLAIPEVNQAMLSEFLERSLPVLGKVSKPSRTRLCHYLDTPMGEYLVGYHPDFSGLFLATGDSGHGYKFMPVLGEKTVDVLMGADAGASWAEKWKIRERLEDDEVWCEDGSRAGQKGLKLADVITDCHKSLL